MRCRGGTRERGSLLRSGRAPQRPEAQLLYPVLPSEEIRRDDAQGCEHGHAPVVQLAVPHVQVVHAEANGVTEIAHLFLRVLRPNHQLHDA